MEKYYIVHYPSFYGMGSNVDFSLVTEKNLRRIIELEIEKKKACDGRRSFNENYSDRFTGTWLDEKFCKDSNIDNVIDDVIQKRLTTCSTYANVNDLIELPPSVPVTVSEETCENTIFRVCNVFDCVSDIIVGTGVFRRYKIDLTNFTGNLGIKNGLWHEFVEYDLKNVAELSYFKDKEASRFLRTEKDRLERFVGMRDGGKRTSDGTYMYDYFPELYTYESCEKEIECSKALIEKFSNLPDLPDEYEKHVCSRDYDNYRNYINEFSSGDEDKLEDVNAKFSDYTKLVYDYPMLSGGHDFACEIKRNGVFMNDFLSYEELFKKGSDVRYLMADFSDSAETKEELGNINFFHVLQNVFVYE